MRYPEDKIKEAILHPDLDVREPVDPLFRSGRQAPMPTAGASLLALTDGFLTGRDLLANALPAAQGVLNQSGTWILILP